MLSILSQEELQALPISELARNGYLPEYLSIGEIVDLYLSDLCKDHTSIQSYKLAFTNTLISACENNEIKFEGDISGWIYTDTNPYPMARNGRFEHPCKTPESFTYINITRFDGPPSVKNQVSKDKRVRSEVKSDHFSCSSADCTIHKLELKLYLENKGAWPVNNNLLAKWWDQDATLVKPKENSRKKQINEIINAVKEFGYEIMAIETGGKKRIKAYCLKTHPKLFTPHGFDHAWKSASKKKLISIYEKEKYLSKS